MCGYLTHLHARRGFLEKKTKIPGGTICTYAYGGQFKKFLDDSDTSLHPYCNPKISAHFILRNLYMNIKYPETMRIDVRIASSEPRNISSTIFGDKNIMNLILIFFGPKSITFSKYSNPKYRTYLPTCAFAECAPPGTRMYKVSQNPTPFCAAGMEEL